MGRHLAAVFAAALVATAWTPAGLGWINPETTPVAQLPKFDATARLTSGGVLVAGPLACTAKEKAAGVRARIRVTLAQRSAKASGEALWRGGCEKARWKVNVPAARPFAAGPARACALGTQTKAGAIVDTLIWCQTIRLTA